MTGETPMSVVEQESIAGPSNRRIEDPAVAQEVQELLKHLEGWVNLPKIMLEEGVTERHRIPVTRLRIEASQLETMRLRHLAGRNNGPTYPQSTRDSVQDLSLIHISEPTRHA